MEYKINYIRELNKEINQCKHNFKENEHKYYNRLRITEDEINGIYEDSHRHFKRGILYTEEHALRLNKTLQQSLIQIKEKREEAELNIKEKGFVSNVVSIYNQEVLDLENQYLRQLILVPELYKLREALEQLNKWYEDFISKAKSRDILNRLIVMENILDSVYKQFKLNIQTYRPVKNITLKRTNE